jgi:hypothetical protein
MKTCLASEVLVYDGQTKRATTKNVRTAEEEEEEEEEECSPRGDGTSSSFSKAL